MSLSERGGFDELFRRAFEDAGGTARWPSGGYNVPTDIFHAQDKVVVRMDLAGVDPGDVDVTCQQNALVVNGRRQFPYDAESVRFLSRGIFYGDFSNRIELGKGLNIDGISARYDNGVLELVIPYAEEVQPRRIAIETSGGGQALST